MLMHVYPHSQQGQGCTERGGEGICAVEGGVGGGVKEVRQREKWG